MERLKIYIAAPFFNEKEIQILSEAEKILRDRGFDVFSPREHDVEVKEERGTPEWGRKIFQKDREGLDWTDCMVMLYWGSHSDTGTAWECGYAYAKNIPVIVVQLGEISNLMIHEGSHANIMGIEGLKTYDFDSMPRLNYTGRML